jgi:hypothetical protein
VTTAPGGAETDGADLGGDPPCWEGLVDDHRDHPRLLTAETDEAPFEP